MQTSLVILAAGMGSRYGGLKQLDSFGPAGETIIDYSVYDAIRAGFNHVVFVIRRSFAEEFQAKIGSRFADKIEVQYVYQDMESYLPEGVNYDHRTKPRGTGHAVLTAQEVVEGPFAVINADDYYGIESFEKMYHFLTTDVSPSTCGMVGYVLKNTLSSHGTVNRGICTIQDGHLEQVQERHKLERRDDGNVRDMHDRQIADTSIVSMNFWGFDVSIFDRIQRLFHTFLEKNSEEASYEFYIPSVVNDFIHEPGNVCTVLPCTASRCGVTYPEDKQTTTALLQELTQQDDYPTPLWTEISPNKKSYT